MATTKEQVREKTITLIKELEPKLISQLDHLLESGAIDFETLNDDWKLPKMIVRALGEYITRVHTNYYENRNDKKEYKNITYYI